MKYSLISDTTRLTLRTPVIPFITKGWQRVIVAKYGNLLDQLMHYSIRPLLETYIQCSLISYTVSVCWEHDDVLPTRWKMLVDSVWRNNICPWLVITRRTLESYRRRKRELTEALNERQTRRFNCTAVPLNEGYPGRKPIPLTNVKWKLVSLPEIC